MANDYFRVGLHLLNSTICDHSLYGHECQSTSASASRYLWTENEPTDARTSRNILIEHDGRLEWLLQREGADVI